MKHGFIETIVGFFVICVSVLFFIYIYNVSNQSKGKDGYALTASFESIEGILQGSDVKMSGVKIGYVDSIELSRDTFLADVKLCIDNSFELPEDSRAIITSSGLIGNRFINIVPGGAEESLKDNDNIKFTQSALNIEDLISKLMYALTSKPSS